MNDKVLVIWHGGCIDGFGAAWAVAHALGADNVELYAATYQKPPPDVQDRHVVIVDFSYKRPVLLDMAASARTVLVLDHHKTAHADLQMLEAPPAGDYAPEEWADDPGTYGLGPWAIFDMARSGAGIAWDYFHPGVPRPGVINQIEDRALYRLALPESQRVHAALQSYAKELAIWDELILTKGTGKLALEGHAIWRALQANVSELLPVVMRRLVIANHDVPVASLPITMTTEAGHRMALGEPFAACYWDTATHRIFSLRSREGGIDVSEIARGFGGGGHAQAAGFEVPRDHPLARS